MQDINSGNFESLCIPPSEDEKNEALKYCFMLNHHIKIKHALGIALEKDYLKGVHSDMHWYKS